MIPASGRKQHQHRLRSWVSLARPGTDLRHATAPRAPAEAGGTPDGAGGTTGARSETEWARRVRREERKANITVWGACGKMAAATKAEWTERTAARRYEACGWARKWVYIFEKERCGRHKKETDLVGRVGPGRQRLIQWMSASEHS